MRVLAFAIAVLFVISIPLDSMARRGGGGGGMRGGGGRGGSMSRPSGGGYRGGQTPSASTRPSSGFNLNNDLGAMQRPSTLPSGPGLPHPGGPSVGNQLPGGPGAGNQPGGPSVGNQLPGGPGAGGQPGTSNRPGGGDRNRPSQLPSGPGSNRPGGGNPDRPGVYPPPGGGGGYQPPVGYPPGVPAYPTWGWNYGYPWYPAPYYWGGGFWGGLTVGIVMGEEEEENEEGQHETVTSYEVMPDSPGSKMLSAYGLQQTRCGGQNLVVIWGPENSVICANPNSHVAAGTYGLDSSNLTLIPQTPAGQQPAQPQTQPQAQPQQPQAQPHKQS